MYIMSQDLSIAKEYRHRVDEVFIDNAGGIIDLQTSLFKQGAFLESRSCFV